LLHAPDLLLLDEPFTGLDRAGRDLLAHLLAALAGDGHTVVLSLHDPTPVAAVVTRSAILHRGRLTWVDGGSAGDPQVVAAAYDRVVGEA
jgi:ABC-type multidrug transport system ATPase subunit